MFPNKINDPFWSMSAANLFSGITYEIIKHCEKENLTFENIMHFNANGKIAMENISEYVKNLNKVNPLSFGGFAKNTFSGICAMFQSVITEYAIEENL